MKLTAIAAAALLAAPLVITASPAAASSANCPPVRHATGKVSLLAAIRKVKLSLSGEIITMVECDGNQLTRRQRAYIDAGDFSARMPKGMWYWTGPGTGGLP